MTFLIDILVLKTIMYIRVTYDLKVWPVSAILSVLTVLPKLNRSEGISAVGGDSYKMFVFFSISY